MSFWRLPGPFLAHKDEFWCQNEVKKWPKMVSRNHQKSDLVSKPEKVIFTSVFTMFLLILAPPKSIIFRPLRRPKIDEKMNLKKCFNKKQKKHNLERSCVEKCPKMGPKMGPWGRPAYLFFNTWSSLGSRWSQELPKRPHKAPPGVKMTPFGSHFGTIWGSKLIILVSFWIPFHMKIWGSVENKTETLVRIRYTVFEYRRAFR